MRITVHKYAKFIVTVHKSARFMDSPQICQICEDSQSINLAVKSVHKKFRSYAARINFFKSVCARGYEVWDKRA